MGFTDTVRNNWLKTIFNATNYTANTNIYISLHTGDPGTTGANEATGGSYARVNGTGKFATPSGGSTSNNDVLQFPTATANWGNVGWVGTSTASSAGTFLGGGALFSAKDIDTGDTASFASGTLTGSIT